MLCINTTQAWGDSSIPIGNVSAIGDLSPGNNITLEVTAINTYASAKTRDIGLVLPYGLINYSPLVIEDVVIPADGFATVNFSIYINSTGDYELLFYTYEGYGIDQYKIMHLIIGAFPDSLPISIIINETVYVEEIPVDVYADINVTQWLTNNFYPNITLLVNETEYNTIHTTIINNITQNVIVNVVNNYSQWQWQNQSQWIIFDVPAGILYGSMAALGLIGVHNVVAGETTIKTRRRRRKGGQYTDAAEPELEDGWEFERRVQYGYGLLGAIFGELLGVFLIYQFLPTSIQDNFALIAGSYAPFLFGIFIALGFFFIILSLDEPVDLLGLGVLGTIFALFVSLFWFLFSAIFLLCLIAVVFTYRKRHAIQETYARVEARAEEIAKAEKRKRLAEFPTDAMAVRSREALITFIVASILIAGLCVMIAYLGILPLEWWWIYIMVGIAAGGIIALIVRVGSDARSVVIRRVLLGVLIAIASVSAVFILIGLVDFVFLPVPITFGISFGLFALSAENIISKPFLLLIAFVVGGFIFGAVIGIIEFLYLTNFIILILTVSLITVESFYLAIVFTRASDDRFWGIIIAIGGSLLFITLVAGAYFFTAGFYLLLAIIFIAIGIGALFVVAIGITFLSLVFSRIQE